MLYKHIRVRHPEYFPQFKKEQDLTPNMKKAMNRFRKGIKCEDEDVKFEFDGKPLFIVQDIFLWSLQFIN